jgi:hypothetical protein
MRLQRETRSFLSNFVYHAGPDGKSRSMPAQSRSTKSLSANLPLPSTRRRRPSSNRGFATNQGILGIASSRGRHCSPDAINRPGGNVTGVVLLISNLGAKRIRFGKLQSDADAASRRDRLDECLPKTCRQTRLQSRRNPIYCTITPSHHLLRSVRGEIFYTLR